MESDYRALKNLKSQIKKNNEEKYKENSKKRLITNVEKKFKTTMIGSLAVFEKHSELSLTPPQNMDFNTIINVPGSDHGGANGLKALLPGWTSTHTCATISRMRVLLLQGTLHNSQYLGNQVSLSQALCFNCFFLIHGQKLVGTFSSSLIALKNSLPGTPVNNPAAYATALILPAEQPVIFTQRGGLASYVISLTVTSWGFDNICAIQPAIADHPDPPPLAQIITCARSFTQLQPTPSQNGSYE